MRSSEEQEHKENMNGAEHTKTGVYSETYLVSPDYCDQNTALSPIGVLTILQSLSAIHAQLLGIGVHAMYEQKKFWVMVHNRVEFDKKAWLLDRITAETWAEECDPESTKCFRSYTLEKGGLVIAKARTEWAILGADGSALPFRESGFPKDYAYSERGAVLADPVWFEDDLTEADLCDSYTVRSTDIDFGRHMNNIHYVRRLLDQFPAKAIVAGAVKSIEIHYGSPCRENEKLKIFCRKEGSTARLSIRNEAGRTSVMAAIEFYA